MTGPKTPPPRKDTRSFKSIANVLTALVALCALASLLLYTHTRAAGTTFYSQGSLPPEALVSWNTSRNGGGAQPLNFTSGDTFVIQNTHNMSTAVAWTVSGTGATVEIESGGTLTANNIVAVPNFQVDNGGTYVHNATSGTANGTASDVPGSTSRTFGATSTVEFQKWANGGTGPVALPSGVSWGNLKINVATLAGSWSQGGNLTSVQGNLTIQSTGGTTREFRLGASTSPTLTVGGDLIISGGVLNLTSGTGTPTVNLAGNYNQSGGTLTSTGSGVATVNFTGGSSLVAFTQSAGTLTDTTINWSIANGKTVQLNSAFTLAASRTFTINSGGVLLAAATITNSGTMSVGGEFRLTDGGFATGNNFTYTANGTLGFTTAGGYFVDSTHVYWPATNGPVNVNVIFGGITLNATRTVSGLFQTSSGVTLSQTLTLSGTCQINDGGFFNNPPTYGSSSLLKYNISLSSPAYGRNNEWSPGATSQPGYPANVQLSNHTTLNLPNGSNSSAFQMSGTLTIDPGTTLDMGALTQPLTVPGDLSLGGTLKLATALGGDFKLGGNWTRAAAGTLTPNSRAVFFNGAGAQTVTVTGGGTQGFDFLVVDKSGGSLSPSNVGGNVTNLSVNATTGNVLQLTGAGGIDLGGQTLTMSGGGGSILVSGGARTITSTGGTGTFAFNGAKTVASASGGTLVFDTGVTVNVGDGVDFGAGLSTINGTLSVKSGGFDNTNPPVYATGATLEYDNGTTYNAASEFPATGVQNVRLASTTQLILNSDKSIAGTFAVNNRSLALGGNKLTTSGANAVTVGGTGTVTRTSGYIIGTEQKTFAGPGPVGFTFDVGTANGYSPADANSTTGTGTLSVKPTQAKQPNVPGTNALSRYWTLAGSGVTTNLTFHYLAGDVVGTESNYEVVKYNGSFSVPPGQSVNAAAHTATVNGVNSFSDWTLAEGSSVFGDYTVTTGATIVVTDVSGNGDTLVVTEPAAGQIKFAAAGRTFSVNGGAPVSGDSGNLSLSNVASVTVNQGGGDDTANVGAFTFPLPNLTINGGAGNDTVNFNGSITFAADASLDANLQDDTATPGTDTVNVAAGAQLVTSGAGTIDVRASRNVTVGGGALLQTQNGNLTVEANQQATATAGAFDGVDVAGGTVQSTGGGNVGVKGTGGTADGVDIFGVQVSSGGQVLSTGSGTISVNGTGGARAGVADNTGFSNVGVYVTGAGSLINSASAAIQVTGTGGPTDSTGSYGVVVDGNGKIQTSGAGTLTIDANGGTVTGGEAGPVDSAGVFVVADVNGDGGVITSTGTGANAGNIVINGTASNGGAGAAQGIRVDAPGTVTTVDGQITFNGTGGACSNACLGTSIRGAVTATGAGAINLTGTGAATNGAFPVHGVNVRSGGAVTTKDGDITITGTGGSGSTTNDDAGFNLASSGTGKLQTTGSGNIVVNADIITVRTTTAATVDAGTHAVTLKQKTAGTAINLGSTVDTTPSTVELSNAELARVTAGTINFGDANSGAITVGAAITRAAATNLSLTSGGAINLNASSLGSGGGNVTLAPGSTASVNPSASGADVSMSTTGTLAFTSGADLSVVINGTTADTQYTQLNVAGKVDLTGTDLALSGSLSPSPGQQFVVVNNDGADAITGNFNGLPEGATITNFLGSAFDAKITYAGGDGNDAVITVLSNASFSIDDVTQAEGNSGTTDFVFTVTKTGAGAASVDFFTADGSATEGEDYQSNTGTLSFASADTTKTVTVHVNGDTTYERDETFSVNLTNASAGAAITDNQGLGTITNDDAPPSTLVVNTTDDDDFGACLASHCSLREAIHAANFSSDASTINFNIPNTDTGCTPSGVCTIAPSSDLPAVTAGPTIIDGYTQTGASANNATTGSNAVLKIVLSGANDTGGTGLELTNTTVRGLVVNGFGDFGGNGLLLHAGNTVAGNFVGTDDAGAAALANDTGVHILDNNNTVGGTTPADRNVVSGNNLGIFSDGTDGISTGVVIEGNLVGTTAAGDTALGNFVGVEVCNGSTNVEVGGSTSASANVISGNAIYNVLIDSFVTHDNKVQGNLIGPKADGTGTLAPGTATSPSANVVKNLNAGVARRLSTKAAAQFSRLLAARAASPNDPAPSGYGVFVDSSPNNTIGGTNAGEGNTIAFNSGKGVAFTGTTPVAVLGNSVHDNGDLGIDGGDDGVTPNDSPDSDGLTNFPVIDSALVTGSTLTVSGSLHAEASTGYRLEFFTNASCDPSGNGEGETFVGTTDVTTDGNGDATFTFHPSSLTAGQSVTATATNTSSNSTSEFSACATAQTGSAGTIEFSQTDYSVAENAGVAHITIKRVGGSDGSVSATFSTSDGTATTADNDYVAVAGQTVTFADGDTADKTVDVTVNDDSTYETDETVNLSLSGTTVNRPGIGSGPSVSSVVTSATLTITNDDAPPSLSIDDVTRAEGNSGTTDFTFTVTKTGATEVNASVNFATQDGSATVADNDYQSNSGTLTFLPADTTKTVTVHVNGDTTPETDETFTVHLSGETDATVSRADGTGTIQNDDESASAGQLLISEFRLRGPGSSAPVTAPVNAKTKRWAVSSSSSSSSSASGGTQSSTSSVPSPSVADTSPQANDEFVELYNNTDSPLLVTTTDGSKGWALAASDGVVRFVVPAGTVIPARGHFLGVNTLGYSLANYPSGNDGSSETTATGDPVLLADGTPASGYTLDIPDNAGIAVFRTATSANFSTATRLDAVGSTSESNTLYKEGAGYPALSPSDIAQNLEGSFYRSLCSFVGGQGCTTPGVPKNTGDNSADFLFVDTEGTQTAAGQRLGAPGPENLSSPVQRNSSLGFNLLDRSVSSALAPNRVRNPGDHTNPNSTFGTLSIRRRVTNTTAANVTRLRFRVVEVTTFPSPSGVADLRALSSGDVPGGVTNVGDADTCAPSSAPCTVAVGGTTLEEPPAQSGNGGGGFNSSLKVGTVTLATPLHPGQSVDIQFLLGVQQTGSFRFLINIEALP
jgi:CSLREA domain-containing protein